MQLRSQNDTAEGHFEVDESGTEDRKGEAAGIAEVRRESCWWEGEIDGPQ